MQFDLETLSNHLNLKKEKNANQINLIDMICFMYQVTSNQMI